MFWLKQKLLTPGAKPLTPGRLEDAGYDIFSTVSKWVNPGESVVFSTGVTTAFAPGWVGLIHDRSSTGWKGLMRQAGVIDSGYRNEWFVRLLNTSQNAYFVESVLENADAKAFAQVIFVPYGKVPVDLVETLPEAERGLTWNGATDKS